MNKKEKKETAVLFADSARLEQLRKLGKSGRNAEEEREFSRLYQAVRRRDQRAQLRGETSLYDKFETAQEFWAANRLLLPKKKLDEYLAQQELVLDQEWWMQHGFEADPNDENEFVGLQEGLKDLDAFIAQTAVVYGGTIHDHPTAYHSAFLRDHTPCFAAWCPRDSNDSVCGHVPAFFKDREVFDALCNEENEATETMTRYGIKTALSSWEVLQFKKKIANHPTGNDEHGLMIGPRKWYVPGCWLCGLEAKQRDAQGPSPQA